jgi:hypothetical protein
LAGFTGAFHTVRLLIDHQKDGATVVLQARDSVILSITLFRAEHGTKVPAVRGASHGSFSGTSEFIWILLMQFVVRLDRSR